MSSATMSPPISVPLTGIAVQPAIDAETRCDAIQLWARYERPAGHASKLAPPEALLVAYEAGRAIAVAEVHRHRGIVGLNRLTWSPDADVAQVHAAMIDCALQAVDRYAAASGW